MRPNAVVGWDIGGAHIKVAQASSSDCVNYVAQLACPLWLGVEQLQTTILQLHKEFEISIAKHAITMTGELVDHFNTRKEGVIKLIDQMSRYLHGQSICFFAGDKGLVAVEDAQRMHKEIASANWLASAKYITTKVSDALFIDIGSTTTDIIRIKDNKVVFDGYTDAERLYTQELVYCGVVRTPIFAICKSAPIHDKFIPVINEYFSATADIYRLTEELPKHADLGETADGRNKDELGSAVRLARIFGHDANEHDLCMWRQVAEYVREQQLQMIIKACRKQLSKPVQPLSVPIIGAGVGRFLVKEVANRLNRQYIDFETLIEFKNSQHEITVGDCAPAASVACLGYQRFFP